MYDEYEMEEYEEEPLPEVPPHNVPCNRKVLVGRKKKVCNDPTGSSVCGRCSNHCQDGRCPVHS
jgi:hypothetical protein